MMRSSRKDPSRAEGLRILREDLAKATPFEIGLTDFEGTEWQLIIALTSDTIPNFPKDTPLQWRWTGQKIDGERWLFLQVEIGEKGWSFAFDCNESEVAVSLRQLLRDRRLMLGFPIQKATRLEGVVDDLVKELGDVLDQYIPKWKKEYYKT